MTQEDIDLVQYFQNKALHYDNLVRSEKTTSKRVLYRRMKTDYKKLIKRHLKTAQN